MSAMSSDRQARMNALLAFQTATAHGYKSLDELHEAIEAVAVGRPFDLPPQGQALVASGRSVLNSFVRMDP